ncbi:tetratricopeptide repeat protein [Streptomyces decoyicus]|uniref:tetratricopeptide repeat protein n=1 Tax=Streptomyces decoyicus TaxID=249567 RepID=UPI002E1750B8
MSFAQTAIENAPAVPGQSWASHYSHGRWAHESGMIHATMGDLAAAEEHLHLALDIHGLDRKRTRAIVLADLGHVQLKRGNTAQALATWNDFLDCADGVQGRAQLKNLYGTDPKASAAGHFTRNCTGRPLNGTLRPGRRRLQPHRGILDNIGTGLAANHTPGAGERCRIAPPQAGSDIWPDTSYVTDWPIVRPRRCRGVGARA